MYEIWCDTCGKIGFHPSRIAAESRAETHVDESGHSCSVGVMGGD